MNRTEALAPLGNNEARFPLTAGILIRGNVRKAAMMAMVDFYEEKRLLESTFIFRGDKTRIVALHNWLQTNL